MPERQRTAPAGDVDYAVLGVGYSAHRREDPRFAARIHAALGTARTVLNVGAGAGSYEPTDRHVIAIEPSPAMRAQRAPHLAPAMDAVAEELPLDDGAVDAAMATLTVHQWRDTNRGLRELRRVARGPVVILTFDGGALDRLWLADYVPELIAAERLRFPPAEVIAAAVGGRTRIEVVPVPIDCVDGFTEAYYARPERFLEPAIRRSQSAWSFAAPDVVTASVARLARDLESGAWDERYGALRTRPEFEGSLRLIISEP